jgi:hypothetical protein
MDCPKCGKDWGEDFDGFGVIYCPPPEGCGFCRHLAKSGDGTGRWTCDYCGEVTVDAAPKNEPKP